MSQGFQKKNQIQACGKKAKKQMQLLFCCNTEPTEIVNKQK